ncbi:Cyclin-L1 [Varanus komodoensis]|nr:Cyclin-L1 [Varanus komodoensis]
MVFLSPRLWIRSRLRDRFWRKQEVLQHARHFRGRKNRCYSLAVRAVRRAFVYATIARRLKKREMRLLWQDRIEAASLEHGVKYRIFISNLAKVKWKNPERRGPMKKLAGQEEEEEKIESPNCRVTRESVAGAQWGGACGPRPANGEGERGGEEGRQKARARRKQGEGTGIAAELGRERRPRRRDKMAAMMAPAGGSAAGAATGFGPGLAGAAAGSSSSSSSSSGGCPAALAPPQLPPPPPGAVRIGDRLYSGVLITLENCLLPDDALRFTPSMGSGLDAETEAQLRVTGCELIQAAGILLRLPQVAMATGQVLFQRFFYTKSFVKHSMEHVSMACVHLASKIEEAPRRIRDVINVFHRLRFLREKKKPVPLILDQDYVNLKNQIIKAERRVLKELGFCVHVKHPHKGTRWAFLVLMDNFMVQSRATWLAWATLLYLSRNLGPQLDRLYNAITHIFQIIVMYLQVLECERSQHLVQTSWNYMNDSLRTDVFVRFHPESIACACIYLAARTLQIPLPNRPHWFLLFGATEEEIQEICMKILQLYTRKKVDLAILEGRVEKKKLAIEEAKAQAKGLLADGKPSLDAVSGFSPVPKTESPKESKGTKPSPLAMQVIKNAKRKTEGIKKVKSNSPINGIQKGRESRSRSGSREQSYSRSPSRSPSAKQRKSESYSPSSSSKSHSRSRSRSDSPPRQLSHSGCSYRYKGSKTRSCQKAKGYKSSSPKQPRARSRSSSRSRSRSRERSDRSGKYKKKSHYYREQRPERPHSYERPGHRYEREHPSHSRHRR